MNFTEENETRDKNALRAQLNEPIEQRSVDHSKEMMCLRVPYSILCTTARY